MIGLFILLAAALVLLNAFFVLAEFSVVRLRPSRVDELIEKGYPAARLVRHVQTHLDEYLSVCQVGITLASVGLGFVGEPAFATLIERSLNSSNPTLTHAIALTLAYLLVSFVHILIGELVPKLIGIRAPSTSALWTARPLRFFRWAFYLPLVILNFSARGVLAMLGFSGRSNEPEHSEDELRIILARSQTAGMMSFRRLLLLENIFDLTGLVVRDAMRFRSEVKCLRVGAPWEENWKVIRESRFSRFPIVAEGADKPVGILHVKDLLYAGLNQSIDLTKLARPYHATTEDTEVEGLLGELQRRRAHVAIVFDKQGRWTGFITMEDIIEELIGTVEDEYEVEPRVYLSEALTPGRVILDVRAETIEDAIREALSSVGSPDLPCPRERLTSAILQRERAVSTYLGRGVAIPHARIEGVEKAAMVFCRSRSGIPVKNGAERAHLLFILVTPVGAPHLQVRLLARIGGILESEFVEQRLREAGTAQEVLEAIRAAETAALG